MIYMKFVNKAEIHEIECKWFFDCTSNYTTSKGDWLINFCLRLLFGCKMVSKLTKKWKVSIQSFSHSDIFAKHAANTVLPESRIIYHQEIRG